jgi:nesprin-1
MELERKKVDLDHLHSEARELAAWAGKSDTVCTVDNLQIKWDQLAAVAQDYRRRLDEEIVDYNSYHQALQDTEKWILQTSFHLMSHNSIYITTRQQTDEQTKKHNVSFSLFKLLKLI